jgi:hypothetical protein
VKGGIPKQSNAASIINYLINGNNSCRFLVAEKLPHVSWSDGMAVKNVLMLKLRIGGVEFDSFLGPDTHGRMGHIRQRTQFSTPEIMAQLSTKLRQILKIK